MRKKLKINNTKLIKLQYFDDSPDGILTIGESEKSVPFNIKRVFFINRLHNPRALRGKHAHKKLKQIIFCINGSFKLTLDDGKRKETITMNNPHLGVKIGPLVWSTMTDFSKDCVILVIANGYYNEDEYIREYDAFLKLVKKSEKNQS
jgi:dTDP-4-dehydrorhamnose 3,5-epimerase-like enzyme